mmetsp:Transcript_22687/g.67747  ORF Transcript_22687/g.67747 Transcript_22687/m.67747 type:complete len:208 (-) Transcript_22687:285-908(-)
MRASASSASSSLQSVSTLVKSVVGRACCQPAAAAAERTAGTTVRTHRSKMSHRSLIKAGVEPSLASAFVASPWALASLVRFSHEATKGCHSSAARESRRTETRDTHAGQAWRRCDASKRKRTLRGTLIRSSLGRQSALWPSPRPSKAGCKRSAHSGSTSSSKRIHLCCSRLRAAEVPGTAALAMEVSSKARRSNRGRTPSTASPLDA